MINLNEIKIVLIGDGGVGKTSLVHALSHEYFGNTYATHGINIKSLDLKTPSHSIRMNIWDFGGQEIYHSIHQIFLTKRSIYLIVLDSRQENSLYYWLNTVKNLVGDTPIIVVLNKIDINPAFDINQKEIKDNYPSVVRFVKVSCKTFEGIESLKEMLLVTAQELTLSNVLIPESWNRVKKIIEELNHDYISYDEFISICKQEGIENRPSQEVISSYFHDMGILIHFKNLKLFNTQILNPFWITEAIYKIIDSKVAMQNQGILEKSDIDEIFHDSSKKYPENKLDFILGIMEEFELLLNVKGKRFLVPQLLNSIEPESINFSKEAISIRYKYDFLPQSLFNRIAIRTADRFGYEQIWRYGLLVNYNGSRGILRNLKYEKNISVTVAGTNKKELLFLIREIIKNVNNSYFSIKVEELIPFEINHEVNLISYSHLLAYQKSGKEYIFNPLDGNEIKISEILKSFEPENKKILSPVKIFISYSHVDLRYKLQLLNHLSPLIRLEEIKVWEDGEIVPGKDWENEILTKLQEADMILCLISSDFIASDFCYSIEMEATLKAHLRNEKVLIPIFIRACYWKKLPIAKIQGIPKTAIASQSNSDEGWEEIVLGIDKALEQIRRNKN